MIIPSTRLLPVTLALLGALRAGASAQESSPPPAPAQVVPDVVPAPPSREPADTAALIDEAARLLAERKQDVSAVLSDARFLPAHEFTRFRELVKTNAPIGPVSMASPDEPGTRLVVRGRVLDSKNRPLPGVLIYAYHTDAKGWYSHRGPHIGGNSGDTRHARLFVYVRTDGEGRFELRTIRPAGYPRSDLPQHIHIHFEVEGLRTRVTEILFDDDPRLTPDMREEAARERAEIFKVDKRAGSPDRVAAEFILNGN